MGMMGVIHEESLSPIRNNISSKNNALSADHDFSLNLLF